MSRKLIINADDYGICPEVNRAIENLVEAGKLKNVSVLANSWFFDETIEFLQKNPECCVGIHLNTVEGIPLSPKKDVEILLETDGQFAGLKQILLRWLRAPFAVSKAVEKEWRKQIEHLSNHDLKIIHADSHQHIHAFPPFWRILSKLCREYKIPCLRFPAEKNNIRLRKPSAFALRLNAELSKKFSFDNKIYYNEHFLGFKRAGVYGAEAIIGDLENLRQGITELIVHPSLYDGLPYPKMRGELEYQALLNPKLQNKIEEANIELVTWAEICVSNIENDKL